MKALDRKLLRDLRLMWSQALTIALVVASGVGAFLTTLSAVDSLALARDRFYAQGRFADAIDAYGNAMRILGENPRRLEGLAMADIRASDGIVTERARKAFERAAVLDPKRIEPRLWLAFAKAQDGGLEAAAADYRALIAEARAMAKRGTGKALNTVPLRWCLAERVNVDQQNHNGFKQS